MQDWKLLETETELKEKVSVLRKKCRGHYFTNYQSFHSTLNDELAYTEMYWKCAVDNIYLIKRHDDFYKLFYAIGG